MLLHYAAKWGDVATVRRLVEAGRSIDERDHYGKTPLMWAADSRHANSSTLLGLIELGADVNALSPFGRTPLDEASDPEKARALLVQGADVHRLTEDGGGILLRTPLEPERFRVLLDAGADPNVVSEYGETALKQALFYGASEIVEMLLERGAEPPQDAWFPLLYAIMAGSVQDVRGALSLGVALHSDDPQQEDPWTMALQCGNLEKVKALVEAGADPRTHNQVGQSSLAIAAAANNTEVVRWLLDIGMPIDGRDGYRDTALIDACRSGATESVAILLEAGADNEADELGDEEPIGAARNIDIVRLLVARGADVNHINEEGYWLLKNAAEDGDKEFARDLLAIGANVDNTYLGDTALFSAVRFDEREIVRLLLAAGANPNIRDLDDDTPLHGVRSPEVARMLIAAGADPTLQDMVGSTPMGRIDEPEVLEVIRGAEGSWLPTDTEMDSPLYNAVDLGRLDLAKYHLEHGVPVDSATHGGETPLMAAAEKSDADMVRLLLDAGARVDLRDERGRTALHRAAAPEAFDAYRMMVHGPTPSKSFKSLLEDVQERFHERRRELKESLDSMGVAPPTYGYVGSDSTEVLALLVEAGASLHDEDRGNCTPFVLATALGRASRVGWLLDREGEPEARERQLSGADEVLQGRPDDGQRAMIVSIIASARG